MKCFNKLLKLIPPIALILTLIAVPTPTFGEETNMVAVLEVVEGTVEFQTSGAEDWTPVTRRASVAGGDVVRTGADASALLIWLDDGTLTELGPETTLEIITFDRTVEDAYEINLGLISGRILNAITPFVDRNSRFEVQTPDVNAAVRGTVFAVEVTPDQSTVVVQEGRVATFLAEDVDTEVLVSAGEYIQAAVDTPLGEPQSISDAPTTDASIQTLIDVSDEFLEEQRPPDADPPTSGGPSNNANPPGNQGSPNNNANSGNCTSCNHGQGNNGNGNGNQGQGNNGNGNGNNGNGNGNNENGNGNGQGNQGNNENSNNVNQGQAPPENSNNGNQGNGNQGQGNNGQGNNGNGNQGQGNNQNNGNGNNGNGNNGNGNNGNGN